tara:strand:+ start:4379 stop:4522 length:144 start_codon:yes stop_codon:yes gene_type:complete
MIDVGFIVGNLPLLTDEELDWLEEEIVHWRKQKAALINRKDMGSNLK